MMIILMIIINMIMFICWWSVQWQSATCFNTVIVDHQKIWLWLWWWSFWWLSSIWSFQYVDVGNQCKWPHVLTLSLLIIKGYHWLWISLSWSWLWLLIIDFCVLMIILIIRCLYSITNFAELSLIQTIMIIKIYMKTKKMTLMTMQMMTMIEFSEMGQQLWGERRWADSRGGCHMWFSRRWIHTTIISVMVMITMIFDDDDDGDDDGDICHMW